MIPDTIKYVVISDIHLGHKRNKTTDIITALYRFFEPYASRDDIDIVFLAGDVFDGLLDLSDECVFEICQWIKWLIRYCDRCNIRLRVLEGTPRHDRQQSRLFETIKSIDHICNGVDLVYVKTLSIEYMPGLGIHVLYVPDEWNASTDKTLDQVKDLMQSIGVDKVDISIMHGMFAYQIPSNVKTVPIHSEIEYLSLTKYFIHIGHVHIFSVYERIIANGSFDRLCHGEEEPKGGVEVCIKKDGTGQYWFIENTLAKKFVTLTVTAKEIEAIIKYIERRVKNLPPDSYVRIKAKKDHPVFLGFDQIKTYFPMLNLTKSSLDDVDDDEYQLMTDVMAVETPFIPITITKDNLLDLLFDEIRNHHHWTPDQWSVATKELLGLNK